MAWFSKGQEAGIPDVEFMMGEAEKHEKITNALAESAAHVVLRRLKNPEGPISSEQLKQLEVDRELFAQALEAAESLEQSWKEGN